MAVQWIWPRQCYVGSLQEAGIYNIKHTDGFLHGAFVIISKAKTHFQFRLSLVDGIMSLSVMPSSAERKVAEYKDKQN